MADPHHTTNTLEDRVAATEERCAELERQGFATKQRQHRADRDLQALMSNDDRPIEWRWAPLLTLVCAVLVTVWVAALTAMLVHAALAQWGLV